MSVVRGTSLSGLPELVTQLGGDPAALLESVGIRAADVGRHDVFVSLPRVAMAVEAAAAVTATPDFGRRLAERQGIDIFGPVGAAARTSATVAEALIIFERFLAAYTPGLAVRLCDTDNPQQAFLEFRFVDRDLPPVKQSVELSLGVTLRVLKFLIGDTFNPVAVHLPHEALTAPGDYRRYFGCRLRFASRSAGLVIPRRHLDQPLRHDRIAHETIMAYLGTLAIRGDSARESTEALTNQLLPSGTVSLELIACQLNLHPKTLQRRLAAEGTTFAEIIDQIRRRRTELLLRDTDVTLSQLARELGYAEHSVLSRSCRRWFGCGPAEFRKAGRQAPG